MSHNKALAQRQGLDDTTCAVIDNLQLLSSIIIERANKKTNKNDLKTIYSLWFSNEQLLQKLWKFEPNNNRIKFWEFPHCSCPKSDNNQNYPHGPYYTDTKCPFHSVSSTTESIS